MLYPVVQEVINVLINLFLITLEQLNESIIQLD